MRFVTSTYRALDSIVFNSVLPPSIWDGTGSTLQYWVVEDAVSMLSNFKAFAVLRNTLPVTSRVACLRKLESSGLRVAKFPIF